MKSSPERFLNPSTDRKPVILVVEDQMLVRDVTASYLRDADFMVIEARDAAEAIAVLTSRTPVDLVFTDVQMPGSLDGMGLAAWIDRHHADIPVLVSSGAGHLLELTGKIAPERYIPKPYRLEKLETLIRSVLTQR